MTAPCVLVADDEPAIRRLLRTSLPAQGWRVIEAAQLTLQALMHNRTKLRRHLHEPPRRKRVYQRLLRIT